MVLIQQNNNTNYRTGGQVLVDQLRLHGITQIFCVPGESFLAVIDALHDAPDIQVVVCRQEGGAAMMAEAYGKLTGRPAACFVTRAPGATNASAGLHIADHDSTPMLLFIGQVARSVRGRGALQELDYEAAFRPLSKWATEINDPARIPETISKAIHLTMSGRHGPVAISLPEDMLVETTNVIDAVPAVAITPYPAPAQMDWLAQQLELAERPFIIIGGSGWTEESTHKLRNLTESWNIPVAVSLRRQMLFSTESHCFAGDLGFGANPTLVEQVKKSDLVIVIGGRLSEVPSQDYTLFDIPTPQQTLVHVLADSCELGSVYTPAQAINATPAAFVESLAKLNIASSAARTKYKEECHAAYKLWSDPELVHSPGQLQMAQVMQFLNKRLPENTIMCNGAGNYATWLHRFYKFAGFGTQLAPTSGSMGYGVPAAVSAKLKYPERTVVAFAGDGCFLMHGQEFATAVQYNAAIIVILVDNGMYGTIRLHQEREYPARVKATSLQNPDFAAYAKAFGGHGETVVKTEEFEAAFERAAASGKPAIIHCLIDPEAISPSTTLSAVRQAAHDKAK